MTTKTKAAIASTAGTNLRSVLLAGLAVIALASCGSGDEGDDGSGWVTIKEPTESPTYTTTSEALTLGGSAFVGTVAVNWSNAAGGGGEASLSRGWSGQCNLPFVGPAPCSRAATWTASIPLIDGENVITVTAADSNSNMGRDTITITLTGHHVPTVSSTIPPNVATNFDVNSVIIANFSEQMASASITEATFQLVDGSANPVSGTVNSFGNRAWFTPAATLVGLTTYTAMITTGVRDLSSDAMASAHVWSFTTRP